ncbi:hypothetical protein LTR74_018772 [Friedmanniomyces endolithicus]|nr:hypothetical protein LTR74_018772 [Friedmanniomyces endolithicus]
MSSTRAIRPARPLWLYLHQLVFVTIFIVNVSRIRERPFASLKRNFLSIAKRVSARWEQGELLQEIEEETETDGESGDSDDSSRGNDSVDDEGYGSEPIVDVFKDARRLYPWHGRQEELLGILQQSIERGWDNKAQSKALLDWCESVVFQRVRGDTFKSAMLHSLAVLGNNEEMFRLRQANDFSYMLAGVVYCTRVLAIEVILPSDLRQEQNDEDDKRFRVVSKMLSLLAYGRRSRSRGQAVGGADVDKERRPVRDSARELEDDVTVVQKYLREVDRFPELLLFCIHITGGQPARGSEITTTRFRNGFLQDRNGFVIQGQMVIVTRYHKSQSQFDKPKVIPRFLPWKVGQLLAVYLIYVQPVQEYLSEQVRGFGFSDYVWSNEYGPWGTDRLTKIIIREPEKGFGVRLTTLDYRHVAISLGREMVGDQFVRGYVVETSEIDEA